MKLTLEEYERWYYITGNLKEAEVFAVAIDMQEELWDTMNQADEWRTRYYELEDLYEKLLKENS